MDDCYKCEVSPQEILSNISYHGHLTACNLTVVHLPFLPIICINDHFQQFDDFHYIQKGEKK